MLKHARLGIVSGESFPFDHKPVAAVLGIPSHECRRLFPRRTTVGVGGSKQWDKKAAAEAAQDIMATAVSGDGLLLMGQRSAEAFGLSYHQALYKEAARIATGEGTFIFVVVVPEANRKLDGKEHHAAQKAIRSLIEAVLGKK